MGRGYNPDVHHRRSIRLSAYDYGQAGAYFVTVCTQNRVCLFGEIVNDVMRLNAAGRMLVAHWQRLPQRFPSVQLDAFVVMPNHIHGVIVLTGQSAASLVGTTRATSGTTGATTRVAPTLLGSVVGAYKSLTTVEYVHGVKAYGWMPFDSKLWQRNYYEHIIRDEVTLFRIRDYIVYNPSKWAEDSENPEHLRHP